MLVGLLISYGVLLPTLTWGDLPSGADLSDVVSSTFGHRGAVRRGRCDRAWPRSGRCSRSSARSCAASGPPRCRARRGAAAARSSITERDLPIGIVGGTIALSLIPIAALLWWFLSGTPLAGNTVPTIVVSLVYIVVIGAVIAAVAGYMAGLIGSSNSPISGVGILVVLGIALLLAAMHGPSGDPAQTTALVAYSLFTTAVVFSRRHDLQRQPAGPEDRPARRRDPVEAAGRPRHRRGLRGAGDRAGARPAQHGVRLRGGAGSRARTRWPHPRPR